MMNVRKSRAISTIAAAIIVVIIVVAAVAVVYVGVLAPKSSSTSSGTSSTTSTPPTTTTTPMTFTYGPKNSSVLIDDSCQTGCQLPDSLDPNYAFFSQDSNYLNAVFQDLVVMNGTDGNTVLPVESTGWTPSNNSQQFTFNIRPDVYFSNGDNVTAYTIWFSYVREIYINAPSFVAGANWNSITYSLSSGYGNSCTSPFELPWGLDAAISSVTGMQESPANCAAFVSFIDNMLSNFNPLNNATQAAIIANQHQAYSASGVTASSPGTFTIRTVQPYLKVVQDLGGFSGTHTVDPTFVDANGGVKANTANDFLSSHCEPGTGPYMCSSVQSGLSELTLVANPHYWAKGSGPNGLKAGLPAVIQPPHIPVIEIEYGIEANPTVLYNNFGNNVAALSSTQTIVGLGVTQWPSMWAAFAQKSHFKLSDILKDYGYGGFAYYLGMNTQHFPTNDTNFRLAVVNALNYSQLEQVSIGYNGTNYGHVVLGPGVPSYGPFYNPDNLALPSQNLAAASHYINMSGWQNHFYTVKPDGTVLGDPSSQQLPALDLYYITPTTPASLTVLKILGDSLGAIGVNAVPFGITSKVYDTLASNPKTAPPFNSIAWGLDFNDPIYQQFVCFFTLSCGIATYINDTALASLVTQAAFSTNSSFRLQVVKQLYQVSVQRGYYAWMPFPDLVDWVQPYVKGVTQNLYVGMFYNLLYYQPVTVSS